MCRSSLACTAPPPAADVGLALACDFVIASEDASFVPAYTRLGTNPDGGTTWTVTRLLGPQRALEWLMLGEAKDARAAKDMGLVSRVVPKDALAGEVDALARRIASGPATAHATLKRLVDQALLHLARYPTRCRARRIRSRRRHAGFSRRRPGVSGAAATSIRGQIMPTPIARPAPRSPFSHHGPRAPYRPIQR